MSGKGNAGQKNLRPLTMRTLEEQLEIRRKGQAAQKKKLRQQKTLAELVNLMMKQKLPEPTRKTLMQQFTELDEADMTSQAAMIAGQIQSAIRGNTVAFSALMAIQEREIEREIESKAISSKVYHMDLDMIADTFHGVMRAIRREMYEEYLLHGGRGSTKSSFVASAIIEILRNNKDVHALCVRKVGNTLKDSVYAKIKWAIGAQECEELFDDKKNPLEITLKATGQKIYFRGADKPEKIKSITTEIGYIGVLWFEELDQFSGPEEVRNITQSAIRGGDKAWIFKTFNPPKSQNNWANEYAKVPKKNMLVHHSTYKDVPEDWLGKPFLEEAKHLKEVNPDAYEHEYLGVANGTGGLVFTTIEIRTITDEEIKTFDRIFQGIDWGLAPDPYAFVRLHYDDMRETIYFIDEFIARGLRNTQTAEEIQKRGYDDFGMTCDSAEKKSVLDYRDLGLNAKPALKGPGSVEYGMKWLAGRKIVIDPKRTPTVYEEFTKYEFDRDKDGNIISGYPDHDNHTIDATRYALERYCNKRGNNA